MCYLLVRKQPLAMFASGLHRSYRVFSVSMLEPSFQVITSKVASMLNPNTDPQKAQIPSECEPVGLKTAAANRARAATRGPSPTAPPLAVRAVPI